MSLDQNELRSRLRSILIGIKAAFVIAIKEVARSLRDFAAFIHRLLLFGICCLKRWKAGRALVTLDLLIGESALSSGQGSESLRAALSDATLAANKTSKRRRQLLSELAQDVYLGGASGESSQLLENRRALIMEIQMTNSIVEVRRRSVLPDNSVSRRRVICGGAICFAMSAIVVALTSGDESGQQVAHASATPLVHALPQQKSMQNHNSVDGDDRDLGFFVKDSGGRVIIDCVTVGGQALKAGMRLGDQILAIGRSAEGLEEMKSAASLGQLAPEIGAPVHIRWQSGAGGDTKTTLMTVKKRFDRERTASLKFKASGYEVYAPWPSIERFFEGSPSYFNPMWTYEYIRSPMALLGRPEDYRGRRIAVLIELLPPRITPQRIDLHLFHDYQSPVVHVDEFRDRGLFNALIENDPITNPFVIMHVELRMYQDEPRLYGKLEEIMFLSPTAPDAFKPLTENYRTAAEIAKYERRKAEREAMPATAQSRGNPLLEGSRASSTSSDPALPSSQQSSSKKEQSVFEWGLIRKAIPDATLEEGKRGEQRFILEHARMLVLDGGNVLHVFAAPYPEGLARLDSLVKSELFSADERNALGDLVNSKRSGVRSAGGLSFSMGVTDERTRELPKFWIRIDISRNKELVTLPQSPLADQGAWSREELFSKSRHRRANLLIRSSEPSEEIAESSAREFNNLVEAAGYSESASHDLLAAGIALAKGKALPPTVGVTSTIDALAYRVALAADTLDLIWKKR